MNFPQVQVHLSEALLAAEEDTQRRELAAGKDETHEVFGEGVLNSLCLNGSFPLGGCLYFS